MLSMSHGDENMFLVSMTQDQIQEDSRLNVLPWTNHLLASLLLSRFIESLAELLFLGLHHRPLSHWTLPVSLTPQCGR